VQGGLDVQIKWPNDIYCGGLKVGGALIHTTWAAASQQFGVLTGVGLNVSNSQPTTCLDDIVVAAAAAAGGSSGQQPAAAAAGGQQLRVCKEQLLAAVLTHLEACFDQFEALGFEPLRQPYLDAWLHSNQVVQVADDVAVVAGGPQQQAQGGLSLRIVGLSPAGFLLATDGAGQEWELTPDGNSLDMMQGLLKKKL
jgi:biotin--protein ligase